MKKKHLTVLLVVVGAGMFVAAVCVAAVVWFFVSVFDRDAADETTATRNVTEIRQRFKKGPIHISTRTAPVTRRLNFKVDDIEKYGPALLVDFEDDDGERLLVWTD